MKMILKKGYLLLGLMFVISCNIQTAQFTPSLKSGSSTYKLMHGNKLETDNYGELSLNAGLNTSENKEYYFIKLDYKHPESVPHIYPGDPLTLTIDGIDLKIDAFYVEPAELQVTSYYYIDKLDLIDLGNAKSVSMRAYGGDQFIESKFNSTNIALFREFIHSYILPEVIITDEEVSKNWGFLGFGGGTSHNVWLGLFAEQLKIDYVPNLTDFGALGIGYTEYEYELLSLRPDQNQRNFYISKITPVKEPIWIFCVTYGLTYPVNFITNWSLDVGVTVQYYHYDDAEWQELVKYDDYNPYSGYRVVGGEPYSGTTFGAFIQVGSFWYSINTFGAWNLGVSIPIKQ